MEQWQKENLAEAREVIHDSGFYPGKWKDCGQGIWMRNVWTFGKTCGWIPRIWAFPQFPGRSLLIPGFAKGNVWLWGASVLVRQNLGVGVRSELSSQLKSMRNYLWLWSQLSVPAGAGEKIGEAVETKFTPWYKGELPHHGRIWQAREPAEYRGISLLDAFEEIVDEEWKRRVRNGATLAQAVKVISKFYRWYKLQWSIPPYLSLTAQQETKQLWLYEKAAKAKKKKRKAKSMISSETRARLKAEWKEMKDAKILSANGGSSAL